MNLLKLTILILLSGLHMAVVGQTVSERAIAENKLAIQKINAGDYGSAIAVLRTVVELEPGFATAYYNLGSAYYLSGKLDEAKQSLMRATTIQPLFPSAFGQLGLVLAQQGNLIEAIKNTGTAVRQGSGPAHYNLGCLYIRDGKFKKAVKMLDAANALNPSETETLYNLSYALARIGEIDRAIAETRTLLRLKPTDGESRTMLITLLLIQHDRTAALNEYKNAVGGGFAIPDWLHKAIFGKFTVSVADLAGK